MRLSRLKIVLLILVAAALLVSAFSAGMITGAFLPGIAKAARAEQAPLSPTQAWPTPTEIPLPTDTATPPPADTPILPTIPTPPPGTPLTEDNSFFAPFWEAWDIVHQEYVDQPVDDEKLMQGAIRGMLESLGDPHTSYMDPAEYAQANIDMGAEYEGIGAWVDITGDYLSIVSPMPGSPAEKAGLKPGDVVIAVDGKDMTGMDGNLVIQKIMGPAGSDVALTIRRESMDQPFDVTLTRAKIIVPSVEGKMLEGDLAYVNLYTFGSNTTQELTETLRGLMDQHPKGLILDLRYNGGGYLNTAIEVASQFISGGTILYEEYGDGSRDYYTAEPGGLATDIALVILVNEGTASASEIVAGAIQDYGRGQLVGVTTYGKGSVQTWVELNGNEGAVRVTIAHWLTPHERQINGIGLTPDVVVERTDDDVTNDRDPQLDKAIELLTQP